jgi:hypothetical protein
MMTIDLTQVILAVIGGAFSVITLVIGSWVSAHFKDQQAADTLNNAIKNGLGAAQQAAEALTRGERPQVNLPPSLVVTPAMAVAVQYVLDHAGDEAARFGITPAAIAEKINAQAGLATIAHTGPALVAQAIQPLPLSH